MNENITKRNELLAQKTIAGLKSRNMEGYYAVPWTTFLRILEMNSLNVNAVQ